jgi:hypothetical protein
MFYTLLPGFLAKKPENEDKHVFAKLGIQI